MLYQPKNVYSTLDSKSKKPEMGTTEIRYIEYTSKITYSTVKHK